MRRNTFQRNLIFDTINELKSHPTAEEVYAAVVDKYANISKATVYRNLNQLTQEHYIGKISIPDGADCFDHISKNHYHAKCRSCCKVFDVDMDYLTDLEKFIRDTRGFKFEEHSILFSGTCLNCKIK